MTYFFWRVKPKDVLTPSVVDLPDMLPEQKKPFESLAVSNAFDDEGIGKQDSVWAVFSLTPRVFEKEAEDRVLREAREKTVLGGKQKLTQRLEKDPSQNSKKAVTRDIESDCEQERRTSASWPPEACRPAAREIVVGYWDPEVYHSKLLWPVICLFGASFGALHLLSWDTVFPTPVEQWLWRAAALSSVFSMLIFMQFEKVVLQWGGPLTMVSLGSPVLYFLSRIVMIGGVIAAFRASDPEISNTYVVSTYWVHIL